MYNQLSLYLIGLNKTGRAHFVTFGALVLHDLTENYETKSKTKLLIKKEILTQNICYASVVKTHMKTGEFTNA